MTIRLPEFDAATATGEQKAVLDEILSGPRGNLNGPFPGWIHSPELAQHDPNASAPSADTKQACRFGFPNLPSWLPRHAGNRRWNGSSIIRSRSKRVFPPQSRTPSTIIDHPFDGPDDALIFDFAMQLYENKRITDATFNQAVTRFGHVTVINLVGLLGYYALVAMTLNTFNMRAEGQTELPFPEPRE